MRFCWALLATLGALAFMGADSARANQPIHTNKARFRIPFKYDPAEMQRLGAREIRLYLSTDRGLQWRLAQTVDPRERKFDFVAPGDAEYWFAVRTLDGRGQLHPPGAALEPGLKVVVDTTSPALEVNLRQVEPGRVQLAWNASDVYLDPTTLRLEYIQAGAANWQTVSVIPQAVGSTAWSCPQGGVVAVRGSVSDLAQNTHRAQAQIKIDPANQAGPRPGVPDFRQPIAAEEPEGVAATISGLPPQSADASAANPWSHPAFQPVSDGLRRRPGILQGRYPQQETPEPYTSAPPRVVNSRKFHINYQVEEVGPSGLAGVDLYITEDNGRRWYKYGSDADAVSPFAVEVPREGKYGFALRARSGAGLSTEPPAAGEPPALWVVVDPTPPMLKFTGVRPGSEPNQLSITWTMQDENPLPKPISLYAAPESGGPWAPIAEGLENTGSYSWTLSPETPGRLFLRLTARDVAGNETTADVPEAIVLDSSRPRARIVDVKSIDASPPQQ